MVYNIQMRNIFALFLISLVFFFGVYLTVKPIGVLPVTTPYPEIESHRIDPETMFKAINDWRESQRLPKFKEGRSACEIANKRLPQVIANYSHDGLQETVEEFRNKENKPNLAVTENLAGAGNFEWESTVLGDWINSPDHFGALKTNKQYLCVTAGQLVNKTGSVVVAIWTNLP